MRDQVREKIAGEICLSEEPGRTIRKWREQFNISQQDLSKHLGVSPSVISDYEAGRRKSPGIVTIRKIVDAFLGIDEKTGGSVLKQYSLATKTESIIAIKEFSVEVLASELVDKLKGENLTPAISLNKHIHGFTIIDSIRAITTLSSFDYLKIYGWSSQRALVFTGVRFGRSPMIAIRAHPLKPALVIYQKPEQVDELAVRLAELEGIPLVRTELPASELVEILQSLG
ncbi:MAG: helix-turn-helix domain-containing protein [Thermoplasmata archaeon]|nr:helix-turn-helix domain-containing protein [Thermoplasmata archaeon]MCJ7561933.1 helix-turn-helix domain-containing protein [Thermoplasmata archaeon]